MRGSSTTKWLSLGSIGTFLLLFASACNSTTTETSSGASSSGGAPAAGPIDKAELAGECTLGCDADRICGIKSDDCGGGYCVFDGRSGSDPVAHCSARCEGTECPEGYTCEDADITKAKLCVPKPGLCGDSELQGQEQCDDGKSDELDACGECQVRQPTVTAALKIGTGYFGADVSLAGPLPLAGEANGCGRVSVKVSAAEIVTVSFTACHPNGEQVTFAVKVPNKVGKASLVGADLKATFKGPTATGGIEGIPVCYDCGLSVNVTSKWGSAAGLAMRIDGAFRAENEKDGRKAFVINGNFAVNEP